MIEAFIMSIVAEQINKTPNITSNLGAFYILTSCTMVHKKLSSRITKQKQP